MRGERIELSRLRCVVGDLLHLSRGIPSIPVQRVMNLLSVSRVRAELAERPSWTAIFTKAYAIVANEFPELRRTYVKLPIPYLRQYPKSVASVAFEREFEGEVGVLTARVKDPAKYSLAKLTRRLRRFATDPVEAISDFRRNLRFVEYPWPIRRIVLWLALNSPGHQRNHFGTFAVSAYSGLGAESLHPISPLTSILHYGVIGADGQVTVRLTYDHRVLDGAMIARALSRLEEILGHQILHELQAMKTAFPSEVSIND